MNNNICTPNSWTKCQLRNLRSTRKQHKESNYPIFIQQNVRNVLRTTPHDSELYGEQISLEFSRHPISVTRMYILALTHHAPVTENEARSVHDYLVRVLLGMQHQ